MTISLFGATGNVGSILLERLLKEGHHVTVLVRDKSKLKSHSDKLTIFEGDVENSEAVERCVAGGEAVYVLIGTWGNKITQVYSLGTQNVMNAMHKYQLRRIVCLSSAGIFGSDGGFFGRIIVPLTLWRPFKDKRKQAEILMKSDLDWTLVRPTEIVLEKEKGEIFVTYDKMKKPKISMESLIDFLYQELYNQKNIRKMPIIGD